MGMPVKLSDDLVNDAREEAKAADRSITSQIEHWARLGRQIENLLRHDDVLALKRAGDDTLLPPPTKRVVLAAVRRIASTQAELAPALTQGRTVYQDAGEGRIERIEPDGTRTIGRFENRRFIADGRDRATRGR